MRATVDSLILELISSPNASIGFGCSETEIEFACQTLSTSLPIDYIAFLKAVGWGGRAHWEFYGAGDGVPLELDLISETQLERTDFLPNIPMHLIPIMADGGGNHYCLDTNAIENGYCPVVFWDHDLGEDQVPDVMYDSFTEFLDDQLHTVYEE